MKYRILSTFFIFCITTSAWAEDQHKHDSMHGDTHMMGKVVSVDKEQLKLKTDKGEKTVRLEETTSESHRGRGMHSHSNIKVGEDVTVHGEMMKNGKLKAHEIYHGKCGEDKQDCEPSKLAWSHMHEMRGKGHKMGMRMMEKHKHGKH